MFGNERTLEQAQFILGCLLCCSDLFDSLLCKIREGAYSLPTQKPSRQTRLAATREKIVS